MRVLLTALAAAALGASLVACPSPKMPSGPPPEYEEPPPPSWLGDAAAAPDTAPPAETTPAADTAPPSS